MKQAKVKMIILNLAVVAAVVISLTSGWKLVG